MKTKFFMPFIMAIALVCFSSSTSDKQGKKTVSKTITEQKIKETQKFEVFVFSYTKSFWWHGCQITANFTVSITVNMQTLTVTGVSATLNSGSISCPPQNLSRGGITFTYSGDHVVHSYFSSDVSTWDQAMADLESEIIADVNADLYDAIH